MRRIAPDLIVRCAAASLACVVAAGSIGAQGSPPAACDSLQYRLVDTAFVMRMPRFQNHRTGEWFVLEDPVLLDARDIDRSEVRPNRLRGDTVWSVVATLTPAAARRFATATESHVGDVIAVRIGDDIVETARIDSRLGAKVAIVFGVSKAVADSLLLRTNQLRSACVAR